jgi:ADP-ribosylglycohydrolase
MLAPADSFEKAVLSNTNVGGENCHRGAALGALMGAALGESAIPARFITGLAASEEIKKEIDAFCEAVLPAESAVEQPAAAV